jgi:hypothetical protein
MNLCPFKKKSLGNAALERYLSGGGNVKPAASPTPNGKTERSRADKRLPLTFVRDRQRGIHTYSL